MLGHIRVKVNDIPIQKQLSFYTILNIANELDIPVHPRFILDLIGKFRKWGRPLLCIAIENCTKRKGNYNMISILIENGISMYEAMESCNRKYCYENFDGKLGEG